MLNRPRKPKTESAKRGLTKKERARQYLLSNPSISLELASKVLDISTRTLGYARAALVKEGKLAPAQNDRGGGRPKTPKDPLLTSGVKELEEELERLRTGEGKPLTDEEKRQRLTAIVRTSNDPRRVQDAILAHTKIEAVNKVEKELGPGPPLTEQDRVDRTSIILDVAGVAVTSRAVVQAFTESEVTELCTSISRLKATSPHSHISNAESESDAEGQTAFLTEKGPDAAE